MGFIIINVINRTVERKNKPVIKIDGLPYLEELCNLTNTYWILGAALVRIFWFEMRKLEKCNETWTLYKINEYIL